MARKGTTTFNGKTGVWRTVGGRRIFIATGQSLEEAMKASGKFGKSSTIGEPLPAISTYLEKHGVNYADLDSDEVREYLKEYRRTGKIESLENSKDSKGPGKIQKEYGLKDVRNEMYVDQYKKGEMDTAEFRNKMLQGGESIVTVDKAIAKSFSNDTDKTIQMKGGDKTQYKVLDEATDSIGEKIYKVMENGQEKWVQGDLFEENSAAGKALKNIQETNKANRAKQADANIDSAAKEYTKYSKEVAKLREEQGKYDWQSDQYKALSAQITEVGRKKDAAKKEVLRNFNESMPDDEMYKVAEEISGIKGLTFTKKMHTNYENREYPIYESNDIKAQAGVFGNVIKSARIETFNSSLSLDDQTGEPSYWGTMSLRYESKSGGSNGMELMDIRYSRKNGWEIKDASGYMYRNGKKLSTVSDMKQYFIDKGYSPSSAQDMATEYINNRIVR